MNIEQLILIIRNLGFEVHRNLKSGYVESVYENALAFELRENGFEVKQQYPLNVYYKGFEVGKFRADLIVNDCIIIELKACQEIAPEHEVQLVNYLTATGIDYGCIMNFGAEKYRFIKKTRIYKK